jgi:hypothetical protein
MTVLAWGAKVSPEFRDKVRTIAAHLGTSPSWLMACMAFETGRTFSPWARNPRSSATGLIQFMATTARSLGTTTEALAGMTAEQQLDYVYDYFKPFTGRLGSLGDCYMAILWPPAVGKPDDFEVFADASAAYAANAALDINHDGAVTKRECVAFVEKLLAEGLEVGNRTFEETQPAAPIEDHTLTEVTPSGGRAPAQSLEQPMPTETPSFDWSMLAKAGGAIASIFNPAIGLAITALSPLLQEKITKTVGKHTDDPKVAAEIGKSLSDVVMQTTKAVTGKADDLEAVAVMRRDPALVAKVEQAVTSKLAELAPYLDKVTELEARERADTLTAQDAAAARAKAEAWDMTPWLVGFMGGMVLLVVGFFGAVAIMDMVKNGKVATEVWAALTGVSGTLLGILGTIYAYRFASTQQSAAKNAILGEIARSKTP